LAGFTSLRLNLWFSHFSVMEPAGILESNVMVARVFYDKIKRKARNIKAWLQSRVGSELKLNFLIPKL
jgi:hypothetical protein